MGANGACQGDDKYMYMYSCLLTRECLFIKASTVFDLTFLHD